MNDPTMRVATRIPFDAMGGAVQEMDDSSCQALLLTDSYSIRILSKQ